MPYYRPMLANIFGDLGQFVSRHSSALLVVLAWVLTQASTLWVFYRTQARQDARDRTNDARKLRDAKYERLRAAYITVLETTKDMQRIYNAAQSREAGLDEIEGRISEMTTRVFALEFHLVIEGDRAKRVHDRLLERV